MSKSRLTDDCYATLLHGLSLFEAEIVQSIEGLNPTYGHKLREDLESATTWLKAMSEGGSQ